MKTRLLPILCILTSSILMAQVPKGTLSLEDSEFNNYFMNAGNIPIVKGKILNLSSNDKNYIDLINENPKDVIIAGKVLNFNKFPDNRAITIHVNDPGRATQLNYTGPIDDKGNFKIVFKRYLAQDVGFDYWLYCPILVHPGDSIYIEFDAKDKHRHKIYKNIKFSGDASELNTKLSIFLKDYFVYRYHFDNNENAEKKMQEQAYLSYRQKIRNQMLTKRQKFIEQYKPDPELKNWTLLETEMNCINALLNYPNKHRLMNKLKEKDWQVSLGYYEFIDSLQNFDKTYLINSAASFSLPNYLLSYVIQKSLPVEYRTKVQFDSLCIHGIIDHLKFNKLLQQLCLNQFINQRFTLYETDIYPKFKKLVDDNISESFLKEPLIEHYKEAKRNIESPEIASQAILNEVKNVLNKELLDSILKQHKGKVIYIDFWATWCGPCLVEMPASKQLCEKFKNDSVEFVYLCLDSEVKAWKATLSKFELTGFQYFIDKGQSAFLKNELKISGVPHFLLIDKKGSIKESGTYLRPSQIETFTKIKSLLQ